MRKRTLTEELEQAVYELSTVEPHVPDGKPIGRALWPAYCDGYYQALVAALRAMKAAARKVEATAMPSEYPRKVNGAQPPRDAIDVDNAAADGRLRVLFWAGVAIGATVALEIAVLLAVLIYNGVR